jgi:hypothetical protein
MGSRSSAAVLKKLVGVPGFQPVSSSPSMATVSAGFRVRLLKGENPSTRMP